MKKEKSPRERGDSRFQKQIFVVREPDGDDFFFCTYKSPEDIDNDTVVAIYELREVRRARKTTTLDAI